MNDERGLVLHAPLLAVGEGSHLHPVRAGLSERLRGEEHPFHVLVAEGEGQRGVLVHSQKGGPGVHHPILRVGHQADQVLVGCDAEGKGQQLVLHGVGAERALQVVGRAALQAEPATVSKRRQTQSWMMEKRMVSIWPLLVPLALSALPRGGVPLVVGGTRSLDALGTPSHVEAHLVGSTLDVLLQALVYVFIRTQASFFINMHVLLQSCRGQQVVPTLTRLPVCHEAISSGAETPVAPRRVDTLVLTDVLRLTLVDV